jgi:serine phosphatase RsbU (regulator of sigma subunit)
MATLASPMDRSTRSSSQGRAGALEALRSAPSASRHPHIEPLDNPVTIWPEPPRDPAGRPGVSSLHLDEDDLYPTSAGPNELAMLTRTFTTMAAQMQKREAHLQAALRRERAIATTLQTAFLPQSLPTCPGYAFAAGYHPALREAEVGGDFYDLFRLPGDRIGLLMGDVAGKGLGAATYATMARYTLRAYALQSSAPGEVLARVNAALCESIDDPAIFVTTAYAVLDPTTHTLTCAAAGHWPALLVRRTAAELVGDSSLALGISPKAAYEERRLILDPGDRFVLYTDGLVEIGTEDPMDHLEAVRKTLQRRREAPEALVERLYRDALRRSDGALRDDLALLALRRDPRRGSRT